MIHLTSRHQPFRYACFLAWGVAMCCAFLARAAEIQSGETRELFRDPLFAEGFGAAWSYGETFARPNKEGPLLAYRDSITSTGPAPQLNEIGRVRRDLKTLVNDALTLAAERDPAKPTKMPLSNYRLALFNVGWEGIGHWECEAELSALSLQGTVANRPAADSSGR